MYTCMCIYIICTHVCGVCVYYVCVCTHHTHTPHTHTYTHTQTHTHTHMYACIHTHTQTHTHTRAHTHTHDGAASHFGLCEQQFSKLSTQAHILHTGWCTFSS